MKSFLMILCNFLGTESDIRGGNNYKSPFGTQWKTALVRTGVHVGDKPRWKPTVVVDGVNDAVQWAVDESGVAKNG